jgi:hypothetical protein
MLSSGRSGISAWNKYCKNNFKPALRRDDTASNVEVLNPPFKKRCAEINALELNI